MRAGQIVGQLPITDIEQDDPQAVIAGGFIELREFHRFLLHTRYTHQRADSFTRPSSDHGGRCKSPGRARVRLWPLNCDAARNQGPGPEPGQGYGAIPARRGRSRGKFQRQQGLPVHPVSRRRQPSPSVQDRRAINPVTTGISRSLADSQLRNSGHIRVPEGTDSQADSAGSIPLTPLPARAFRAPRSGGLGSYWHSATRRLAGPVSTRLSIIIQPVAASMSRISSSLYTSPSPPLSRNCPAIMAAKTG